MSSSIPSPISPKTSNQTNEVSIATSLYDINRFFQPKKFQMATASPPSTNQVKEGEFVIDKTALRIYTKVDGVLRYWSLT